MRQFSPSMYCSSHTAKNQQLAELVRRLEGRVGRDAIKVRAETERSEAREKVDKANVQDGSGEYRDRASFTIKLTDLKVRDK